MYLSRRLDEIVDFVVVVVVAVVVIISICVS